MKNILHCLLASFFLIATNLLHAQPCNTLDATGCVCSNTNDSQCDLLPDITASKDLLTDYFYNPEEKGCLFVSVSTPNIGIGPLRVIATNQFLCGTDTVTSNSSSFNCSNGEEARQLIKQRIYVKDGNEMTYYDRSAGSMTYHPTHSHMHVDDWGVYTLREKVPGVEPQDCPIVGEGAKLGFCLMDFGTCDGYPGHCRDADDNILTTDLPNYGLGGGDYTCGTTKQGISVGYTDIYFYNIPGMFIDIPYGTCDGAYWVVVEVDPNNNFLESNEDNNVIYGTFTLAKQNNIPETAVDIDGSTVLCDGEITTLTATFGDSYLWSNGLTTPSIEINEPGLYSCTISTNCGIVESVPISITTEQVEPPITSFEPISICSPQQVQIDLAVSDDIVVNWYADSLKNNLINTGGQYITEEISNDTIFWVDAEKFTSGQSYSCPPLTTDFDSFMSNSRRYNGTLLFDVYRPFILESLEVFADTSGTRVFEVYDFFDNLVHSLPVYVEAGSNRVQLDFYMSVGQNYRIGCAEHPGFYNSNRGVNFPYTVNNLLSIHGSNFGDSFYYFYYNWEVRLIDRTCYSETIPITIEYNNSTAAEIIDLPLLTRNDQSISLVGAPPGGVFSGEGVIFNTFNPTVLGEGMYDITYTVTDENDCTSSVTQSILVFTIIHNFTDYELGTKEP